MYFSFLSTVLRWTLKNALVFSYLTRSLPLLMQLNKCRKLVQIAEKSLKEGTNCYYAIEACNEVLDGHGHEIGSMLMHECLCIRASLLLKVYL